MPHDKEDLLACLAWCRDMGIDAVLADEPIDWFARGDARETAPPLSPAVAGTQPPQPAPSFAPPSPPLTARTFPTAPPGAAQRSAAELAAKASNLRELAEALNVFDGCALKTTAKNTCVYRGAERAAVMLIGEAPGRDEDLAGKPFVGPAGKLLDKMLAAIGLSEADVHIANVVYWRPPGNRTPTALEAAVCRPFLERQIELVNPSLFILLGGAAAKNMLDTPDGIMKLRGTWRTLPVAGRNVPAMPTLHPAYLLRSPLAKRQAWRDLLAIKERLAKAADAHAA